MTQDASEMQGPPKPPAPRPAQRRGPKVVRHSLRALWLLVSLPIAVIVLLGVLLIEKDVSAPSWVKSRVQERAGLILAGGSLAFDKVTINVGRDLHPRVTLHDTTLRDANGAVLAEVREIAGLMSPRGLLLERAALMQVVELRGVDVTLNRAADGTVALAFQRDAAALEAAPGMTALIARAEAVFDRPALAAMEQVRVQDLSLIYTDARAAQTWRIAGGRLALDLRGAATAISGVLPLRTGDAVTDITLEFSSPKDSPAATALISATDIPAAEIATQSPALSWLAAVDAPISATITTGLDAAGAPLSLQGNLTLAAGAIRPNAAATPIRFDSAAIDLAYDPATQITRFTRLDLQSERGSFRGAGQAIAQDIQNGIPDQFVAQFAFDDITFDPPGLYAAPLAIAQAQVDLRLTLDPFAVDIGQAVINDPKITLTAKGHAKARAAGWDVGLDLHSARLETAALYALWPETIKPRTRKWFVENLSAAQFRDAGLALRVRPERAPVVAAHFGFRGADIRFMRAMPHITQGAGFVSFTDNQMALSLDAGRLRPPEGGVVDVAGSTLVIEDVRRNDNEMTLNLVSDSTITAALSLLNQDPLNLMDRIDRPVDLAEGRAVLRGAITFPLGRRPAAGETRFAIEGAVTQLRSTQIVPDRRLAASRVTMAVSEGSLRFDGAVTVDDVPMQGSYVMPIGAAANGRGTVRAQIELSPRALAAFDSTLPPGAVAGSGRGDVRIDLAQGQAPRFEVTSDLRGVTLAIPAIGWSKAPGAEGSLEIAGTLGARPAIDRLEVGGGGLDARGSITFKADGSLDAARFRRVRLGNWLNAPITLRGRGQGRLAGVEIAGGTIDLRRARFGGQGDSRPVSIALDLLQITDGIGLVDFRGDFSGAGGFSGQFEGRVNGAASIQGTVAPQNGRSAVRLVTNDAGGVVRAAGFIDNAIGGTLDLTLLPATGEGQFDGQLAVRNLRVRDAPAMAALLDAISVVGLLQQLDGQGLAFDTVDAAFRLTPREVIVTEASAVGPGLGLSLDGIYTLANKSVDFQGVISPLYLVNQIGAVLTRRGEGLIGFNFNIAGTADNPRVAVNPLSAFTPGMFRDIFRRAPPEVSP